MFVNMTKMYIMIVAQCTKGVVSKYGHVRIMIVMYVNKATALESVLEWLC